MAHSLSSVPLGDTGLQVSPLGLGLAALGRPAYITLGRDLGTRRAIPDLERRTHEVLDAAWRAGIRYVDAARSYGRAEEFLASWLQATGNDPTVGSKWGYRYVGDWRLDAEVHEVKDHSLQALEEQLAESRRILGDHLDLYQIHSATLDSGVLENRAVLGRLAELADEGLLIGLSVSGPRQADTIRAALEVEVDGVNPFRCVQATWNLLEQSAAPALQEAHRAGWGVIIKEALANGRLVAGGDAIRVEKISSRLGVDPDAVAIAACLSRPWADVVLSGATSVAQLESNLRAISLDTVEELLGDLESWRQHPDEYWETRSSLPWR